MSDEDTDWKIYHLIPDEGITFDELIKASGMAEETVRASTARLEKIRLVHTADERICPVSVNDFLISETLCGTGGTEKEDDLGIYIENGVIKVRK